MVVVTDPSQLLCIIGQHMIQHIFPGNIRLASSDRFDVDIVKTNLNCRSADLGGARVQSQGRFTSLSFIRANEEPRSCGA